MPLQFDPAIITENDLLTLHDQHSLSEEHAVPGVDPEELSTYTIPSSKIVVLREVPKQIQTTPPTGVTVTQVPGGPFAEVLGAPSADQFQVNYTDGTVTFNVANVGDNVLISYTATGSVIRAAHVNKISEPFVPFYNKLDGIVPDGGTDFTFPGDVDVTGNLNIAGDLNISGVVNKSAVEVLDLTDNILFLNSGNVDDGAATTTVGIEIARSANTQGYQGHPQLMWVEADMNWQFLSTFNGPTGSRDPLVTIYDKGGLQVTPVTNVQQATLVGTLSLAEQGLIWFNSETLQFMGWNGFGTVILG